MKLTKDNFMKTTHHRKHQQFFSIQQLVEGWVITLTIQMKVTVIAVRTCNKVSEVLIDMLLERDMCQLARFKKNKVDPAKIIRYSSFRARVVLKCEFV